MHLLSPTLVTPMQRFVANASVTPSAVQQGANAVAGVMHAAIEFLSCKVNLEQIARPEAFPETLDYYTDELLKALPDGGAYWGRARKCLNIFLREASYNSLLRAHFRLEGIDALLETPLDSRVAAGLRRDAGKQCLPRWKSVISLTADQNRIYQAVAADVAKNCYGTLRANLDLWYYRPEK